MMVAHFGLRADLPSPLMNGNTKQSRKKTRVHIMIQYNLAAHKAQKSSHK